MTKKLLFVTTILLAAVFGLLAADISGKWVAETPGRNGGPPRQVTFNFKVDGSKLTGTVSQAGRGGNMESEITEGKVDGDNISFKVSREMGGQTMTTQYTGTVSGDSINLKMNMDTPNGPMTREMTAKKATS
jgi:autotransporter translocation and assembly factor TamB